jgi:hypothetical protein
VIALKRFALKCVLGAHPSAVLFRRKEEHLMAEKRAGNTRTILFVGSAALVVSLCGMTPPSRAEAQDAEVGEPVQPAPEIRLTGVLEVMKDPDPSAFPSLSVWIGDTRGRFQVSKIEPIIPAYPAEKELQKVSGLGLRVLADNKVLSALQRPEMHNRPIVLEGWLRVREGVLQVHSARAA